MSQEDIDATKAPLMDHLIELRDHMVKIDTSKLVISRDPNAVIPLKPKKYISSIAFSGDHLSTAMR